jgi:hypothetical protein
MIFSRLRSGVAVLTAMLLMSCGGGAPTTIVNEWADPAYVKGPMKNILVVGIGENAKRRLAFERAVQKELEGQGLRGVASHEIMPGDEKISVETFNKYFRDMQFDGVLISRMLTVETEVKGARTQYTLAGAPTNYNMSFYQYYGTSYSVVRSATTVEETDVYRIETQLYEVAREKAVWAGVSETVDPADASDAISSLTRAIVRHLKKRGYLPG